MHRAQLIKDIHSTLKTLERLVRKVGDIVCLTAKPFVPVLTRLIGKWQLFKRYPRLVRLPAKSTRYPNRPIEANTKTEETKKAY